MQYDFARCIRDPACTSTPLGVDPARMQLYRRLFTRNIEQMLAGCFPVLRSITPAEEWRSLAQDFYTHHRCETPLFTEIAEEFLRYLHGRDAPEHAPPYRIELAHYERVEAALWLADIGPDPADCDRAGPFMTGIPVLSPLARVLAYRYPVHRIGPDFLPTAPEATYLIVVRDDTDRVRFLEINAVTARLLALMDEYPQADGTELLTHLANELPTLHLSALQRHGHETFDALHQAGVLRGTRHAVNRT